MKVTNRKIDFTEGKIMSKLFIFSIPLFFNYFFQYLYNIIDSLVVGIFQSKIALAAIGASTSITNITLGFFTGLSAGSTILIARYYGSKKDEELSDSVHSAIFFSIIIGLIFTVLGVCFSKALLVMTSCPDEMLGEATLYLVIFFSGTIFNSLYNACSTIMLAVGDSKTPFKYLLISSLLKTVSIFLLIAVMKTGVVGAALSTIIAQSISSLMMIYELMKVKSAYKIELYKLKTINFDILKKMLLLALPVAAQQVIVRLSFLIPQNYINTFGTEAIAGISVAQKINNMAMVPANVINVATTTFVAQNIGINQEKRAVKGILYSCVLSFVVAVVIVGLIYAYAPSLVGIFNTDSNVIMYGTQMIRTLAPFFIVMAIYDVFSGTLKGYGMTKEIMILTIISVVIIPTIYLIITMTYYRNIQFIYWYYPLAWTLYFLFLLVTTTIVVRKSLKKGNY